MKKSKTNRGFSYYEFKESYGLTCSLQKSSRADKEEVWVGLNGDEPQRHPVLDVPLGMRMAIDRKLAGQLAKKLAHFSKTGEI